MSLKRQTLWSIVPLLVITALNLFSVRLFYRYLGPEMYALWFYVLTFTGAFGFMDLGLGVAVGRYMGVALGKGDQQAVREYWGTGNAIILPLLAVMTLAFTAIGVVFGPQWFNVAPQYADLLRWSFVFGGLGLFFSYYAQFWLILSQTHLDFKFLAVSRTGTSIIQIVPSIYLAWLWGNPLIVIGWTTLIALLQLGIFVWHGRRSYGLGFGLKERRRHRAHEMAGYTGKTFAAVVSNALLSSADRLVLGRLAPAADFAHYNICANAGARVQSLSTAVMGPVFSNSSRSLGSGVRGSVAAVYNETFNFTFPWYLLLGIWIAIWHPIVLTLWLGNELGLAAAVAPLFWPVVIGYCFTAIANISGAQLGSLDRMGALLAFTVATGLLLVGCVYLGWLWGGMLGVAWGFVLSRIGVIVQDLYVIRLTGAGGWLALSTWQQIFGQLALGAAFFAISACWPRTSLWQVIPATLHLALVASWLLRDPLRRVLQRGRLGVRLGLA